MENSRKLNQTNFDRIVWRLIDEYRTSTGCRWRRRHGLNVASHTITINENDLMRVIA